MRLAGIDAPEKANFGQQGQKYAGAAQEFLSRLVMRKRVTVQIHGFDVYDRAVSTMYVKTRIPFWKRNVALEVVKAGYAVVYKGQGAEYGGFLNKFIAAERFAKWRGRGMWKAAKSGNLVLPHEYKKAVRNGNGNAAVKLRGDTSKGKTAANGGLGTFSSILKALQRLLPSR